MVAILYFKGRNYFAIQCKNTQREGMKSRALLNKLSYTWNCLASDFCEDFLWIQCTMLQYSICQYMSICHMLCVLPAEELDLATDWWDLNRQIQKHFNSTVRSTSSYSQERDQKRLSVKSLLISLIYWWPKLTLPGKRLSCMKWY